MAVGVGVGVGVVNGVSVGVNTGVDVDPREAEVKLDSIESVSDVLDAVLEELKDSTVELDLSLVAVENSTTIVDVVDDAVSITVDEEGAMRVSSERPESC
mgnify:CR=1 FL=1